MWWRHYDNMLSRFNRIPERYGRTNGQTDGRTEKIAVSIHASIYWRAIKRDHVTQTMPLSGVNFCSWAIYLKRVRWKTVTLKSGLALIQGRWNRYRSKAWMWFPICIVTMTIFSRFDTIYERDRQTDCKTTTYDTSGRTMQPHAAVARQTTNAYGDMPWVRACQSTAELCHL